MLSGLRQRWLASSRQITWAISFFFSYIENILNTSNKCGPACTFMHQWFFFSKVLYDGFQSRGLQKYQTRSQNLPIFCPHYLRILVTFRNFAIYARIMVKAEHWYHITKRHHIRTVTDGFRGSTHIKHVPRCGNFVNYLWCSIRR